MGLLEYANLKVFGNRAFRHSQKAVIKAVMKARLLGRYGCKYGVASGQQHRALQADMDAAHAGCFQHRLLTVHVLRECAQLSAIATTSCPSAQHGRT